MSRIRRELAVLVTALLVVGMFASPALAQTAVEGNAPYPPTSPPPVVPEQPADPGQPGAVEPSQPDEPDAPVDEDVDVEDAVEERVEDVDAAPVAGVTTPETETTTVLGITLQRTGASALLLGAIGLLVLGLGGFLVTRTRRSITEA